jgi:N-acetylglucosamine-6-phosphate deacetylase
LSTTTAYTAGRIFDGDTWYQNHALMVKEGGVLAIEPGTLISKDVVVHDYPGDTMLAPAFIDLQIYGAMGQLLSMHPNSYALECLYQHGRTGGTAWTQPTVSTNSYEVFYKAIDAVRAYWKEGGKGIIGLHIEGPWLHPLRRGAHREEWIHVPKLSQVRDLMEYGKGVVSMMTIAPERLSQEIIDMVLSYGVKLSAGHSNATYEEAKHAFRNGVSAVTHLFNAMSPLQHRAPGLAGAAMDDEEVMVSIIPDGYHVDFAAIRIAKAVTGERLFAITDAVTDTDSGPYPHQLAGDKYEANGILSGSALQMNQAARNLVRFAGIETGEALRMCARYPAKLMGRSNITGALLPNHPAQFVVLDAEYNVLDMPGE